jgi:hypothetical protein
MAKFKILVECYLEFQNVFSFLVFLEYVEFFTVFLYTILFFIFYKKNSINTLIYEYFKKLSFKNKNFFAWFIIVFTIPHKIWINNKVLSFLVALMIFLVIALSCVFPVFILFYLVFWILV